MDIQVPADNAKVSERPYTKRVTKQKNYRQGFFTPRNPDKYIGDLSNIVYRSSWELECFKFFDGNPNIIRWSSEAFPIPYIKPTTGRVHRYFPDFYVEYRTKYGDIRKEVIEVKPESQTRPSTAKRRNTRLQEDVTYAINIAKWKAAVKWCNDRGIKFRILTEGNLFRG